VGAHADYLQRHLFTELQISPLPQEDRPHAAFTQQPKNSPRSDASPWRQLALTPGVSGSFTDGIGQGIVIAIEPEEGFDLPAEFGVVCAVAIEKGSAVFRGEIGRFVENALKSVPPDLVQQSKSYFNPGNDKRRLDGRKPMAIQAPEQFS
jgi:hypothetical protein